MSMENLEISTMEPLTKEMTATIDGGAANLAAYDAATGMMCGAAASGFLFGGVGGVFTGAAFGPACGLMLGIRFFAL